MKIGIFFIAAAMATFAVRAQQNSSGVSSGSNASAYAPVGSESPYKFKSAYLGMTLEEFKRVTSGDVVERPAGSNFLGMPRTKKVPTPFCTDSIRGFEGDPLLDLKKGEVVCNPSPADANQDLLVVTGLRLRRITYSFYHGRLYKISLTMSPAMFGRILGAFGEKYGVPHKLKSDSYQNGFGATWRGENFAWERGAQLIVLNEGSAGGPAQFGDSNGVIVNPQLGPPAASQQPLDF